MSTLPQTPETDDMPAEIDFSKGVRGKFYRPDMKMVLPVHLDAGVASELEQSAQREGVEVSAFVARLLDEHRRAARPAAAAPAGR